jgi:hypothetical protein
MSDLNEGIFAWVTVNFLLNRLNNLGLRQVSHSFHSFSFNFWNFSPHCFIFFNNLLWNGLKKDNYMFVIRDICCCSGSWWSLHSGTFLVSGMTVIRVFSSCKFKNLRKCKDSILTIHSTDKLLLNTWYFYPAFLLNA